MTVITPRSGVIKNFKSFCSSNYCESSAEKSVIRFSWSNEGFNSVPLNKGSSRARISFFLFGKWKIVTSINIRNIIIRVPKLSSFGSSLFQKEVLLYLKYILIGSDHEDEIEMSGFYFFVDTS